MQDAFELLRPRSHRACERRVEDLIHLAAKAVDRVCDEAAGLIDCRQRRNRRLIELLHLLGNLVDRLERAADVVLNRAEDRVEDAKELPVSKLRQDKARLDHENDNEQSPLPASAGALASAASRIARIRLSIQEQLHLGLGIVSHWLIASCISPESSTGKGASSASPRGYCAASSS